MNQESIKNDTAQFVDTEMQTYDGEVKLCLRRRFGIFKQINGLEHKIEGVVRRVTAGSDGVHPQNLQHRIVPCWIIGSHDQVAVIFNLTCTREQRTRFMSMFDKELKKLQDETKGTDDPEVSLVPPDPRF